MGLFEELHGQPSPEALARHLKTGTSTAYGEAARAFLEVIVEHIDTVVETVSRQMRDWLGRNLPPGADGQVARAADRFALVAAAGELATSRGILPWPSGEAFRAATACWNAWLAQRGDTGPAEVATILSQVRGFFELHGESRFSPLHNIGFDRPTINRAGFRKTDQDGRALFYVLPQVFRSEICAGLDHKAVERELVKRSWLLPGADGRPTVTERLPEVGPTRVYRISGVMFEGE